MTSLISSVMEKKLVGGRGEIIVIGASGMVGGEVGGQIQSNDSMDW